MPPPWLPALKTADFTVMSMETKPYRRRPQPPFTTSTLQQTAGNRLGMGARAVMRGPKPSTRTATSPICEPIR